MRHLSWLLGFFFYATTSAVHAAPTTEEIASKVLGCYSAGQQTIQKLHDCSGFWVTPRTLLLCTIKAGCPVQPDTPDGRAALSTTMAQEKLTVNSLLVVRPTDLPKIPDPKIIADCRKDAKTETSFQECIWKSLSNTQQPFLKCTAISNQSDRALCFANLTSDHNTIDVVKCVGNDASAGKALACIKRPDITEPARKAIGCVSNATNSTEKRLDCVLPKIDASQKILSECLIAAGKNPAKMSKCIDESSPEAARVRRVTECFEKKGSDPIKCGQDAIAAGAAATMMSCLSNAQTPSARLACADQTSPEAVRAKAVAACVSGGAKDNRLVERCLAPFLGGDAERLAKCTASAGASLDGCLTQVNPKIAEANRIISCVKASEANGAAFACTAQALGGDAPRIAACISNQDRGLAALCLLGNRPEAQIAQQTYACLAGSHDTSALLANCTSGFIKDEKTRVAVGCLARAGNDKSQLAGCAAGLLLPPDAARVVGCATTSQGPTSFALCSAGPLMNEEWRITAECAVQTGGNPVAFGGCTAGRLTIRELTKCFASGFKDCYGPNNEIVKAVNGIGKSTEKAVQDAGKSIETATQDTGRAIETAAHDVGKTGEKAVQDVGKTGEKAVQDVGKTGEKAVQDVGKTGEKAVQDVGKAGEKAVQGLGNALGIHW
jgi:hypothetical protein